MGIRAQGNPKATYNAVWTNTAKGAAGPPGLVPNPYGATGGTIVSVKAASTNLAPSGTNNTSITLNGVTSSWTGLDMTNKPAFEMTTPGAAFQFTESYQGPGLTNQTIIQRVTTIQSVTDTTSTFTQ